MILIISHPADEHAVAVLRSMEERGVDALLFDTGCYPDQIALALDRDGNRSSHRALIDGQWHDLGGVRAAWWRRPLPITIDPAMGDVDDRNFAYNEAYAAITGLWSSLDARWMNEPLADERAARKIWQLQVAARAGLRIPRTRVTNSPEEARAFIEAQRPHGTIYKAFGATERAWRETRLVRPEELPLLEAVRYTPVIFQEHIAAETDLRITMVGGRIFASEVRSDPAAYQVDYRMNLSGALVQPHILPDEVASLLRGFMDRIGLVYGAIDMRLQADGSYVFIEVNPSGQWLFMEERTGQPITQAVVDQLILMAGE